MNLTNFIRNEINVLTNNYSNEIYFSGVENIEIVYKVKIIQYKIIQYKIIQYIYNKDEQINLKLILIDLYI